MTTSDLIGRGAETKIIDSLIDHVKEGGGSLIVRGEPGIGKSALLGHARQRALDLGAQTFATVGVESEAELAFAGVHQLLLPIRGLIPSLPAPQHRALEAVFGIGAEDQPDIFRVAMAALHLLTSAAESAPMVVLVDDAHWLDRSSVRVLAFIARRLEHEAMVLVAAVRAGYRTPFDDASLPALDLERLSPVAAGQLVDLQAPTLHPIVRARVLTEAAGNPLALVELARTLPSEAGVRDSLSPPPTTLTARLERAFAGRLNEIPKETRAVLLAAALDSRASVDEVFACAAIVLEAPAPATALDPAIEAALVDLVDGQIHFRHPLCARRCVRRRAGTRWRACMARWRGPSPTRNAVCGTERCPREPTRRPRPSWNSTWTQPCVVAP